MYYLSHLGHTLQLKNNLEKAINVVLEKHHRVLIKEWELEAFLNQILDAVKKCHQDNPRCKPIKVSFWKPHDEYCDLSLSDGNGTFMFAIYKVLSIYNISNIQS